MGRAAVQPFVLVQVQKQTTQFHAGLHLIFLLIEFSIQGMAVMLGLPFGLVTSRFGSLSAENKIARRA